MLDDRHYMRSDYRSGRWQFHWSATNILIIALVAAFFIQHIQSARFQEVVKNDCYLTADLFRRGYVWQLLTFQFLHAGIGHLFFNGFTLWSFGRAVEERLGKRRFLTLYFLSGICGGLLQGLGELLLPALLGDRTVGASAGIAGVVAAFSMIEPDATILAYFFLPVRARTLLYISIALCFILPFIPAAFGMAHAAHLGGILFGMFYIQRGTALLPDFSEWRWPRRQQRGAKSGTVARLNPLSTARKKIDESVELPPQEFMSQEVDPILDKISAHGIQSLTDRERKILQAARNKMSKH